MKKLKYAHHSNITHLWKILVTKECKLLQKLDFYKYWIAQAWGTTISVHVVNYRGKYLSCNIDVTQNHCQHDI